MWGEGKDFIEILMPEDHIYEAQQELIMERWHKENKIPTVIFSPPDKPKRKVLRAYPAYDKYKYDRSKALVHVKVAGGGSE